MSINPPAESVVAPRTHQGRRAIISREELIDAALTLLGPHRSIATLSLREVAREAGIAPNSFYRHFRNIDELALALIEQAGIALRQIIGQARHRASANRSVVQSSMEVFLEQLKADQGYLHLLLREGQAGSPTLTQAIAAQLASFEEELQADLIRLEQAHGHQLHAPDLVAKGITQLVFSMAAQVMDQPQGTQELFLHQTTTLIQMLIQGARVMHQPAEVASASASSRLT